MRSIPNSGWLIYSLLQLSPPAFFHRIWTDFVQSNTIQSPDLIERLYHAAEQLVANNELENACQVWLICAVLESQRGDTDTALKLTEKTAEFAQNHQLPKIHEWASWGASSFCARQGNWQKAIFYLQRLQQVLNNQGNWVLANIIYILETSLDQLDTKKHTALTRQTADLQLDIILDQYLHWETPNLVPTMPQSASPDNQSLFRRFWHTLTALFKDKTPKQLPTTGQPYSKPFSSLTLNEPDLSIARSLTQKSNVAEKIVLAQDWNSSLQQTSKENPTAPSEETKKRTEDVLSNKTRDDVPSLTAYCLGTFRVYQNEKLIEQWPSGKGKLIFKYLLIRRRQPIAKEVLMEQFWPDAHPDAARNNLNVAIYGLRQALRNGFEDLSHILFQDDHYMLNPELQIWVDFEVFWEIWKTAQREGEKGNWTRAIQDYHTAVSLYQGELFAEDRYEEWIMPHRQHLQDTYLSLLEQLSHYYFQNEGYNACIEACRNILEVDPCREGAHRRLMRCYCRQDQYYLGMRQYHQCEEALHNELDVKPSPETTELYQKIRRHESI